ncbi:kinase-like domain-containing protein [Suillus placidus]|uniref:Kinase-like domain-containing protein n=1 Tax=Suillus placidus TaxID=48579 RepID=A0A9P7A8T1_9AGAM|nr:kinase-like domain-containing protein [Suillus placidus]
MTVCHSRAALCPALSRSSRLPPHPIAPTPPPPLVIVINLPSANPANLYKRLITPSEVAHTNYLYTMYDASEYDVEFDEHGTMLATSNYHIRCIAAAGRHAVNQLCIAMELLSINLYKLIKANSFVGFTTALIQRFTSQMILSLCLMRHHRIVHCDLKPENVLLRHPAKSVKVIDFGSSCLEHEKIQSRFYRLPEVILGMNYTPSTISPSPPLPPIPGQEVIRHDMDMGEFGGMKLKVDVKRARKMTLQVQTIAVAATAVTHGDLTQQITGVSVSGEMLSLVNTIILPPSNSFRHTKDPCHPRVSKQPGSYI